MATITGSTRTGRPSASPRTTETCPANSSRCRASTAPVSSLSARVLRPPSVTRPNQPRATASSRGEHLYGRAPLDDMTRSALRHVGRRQMPGVARVARTNADRNPRQSAEVSSGREPARAAQMIDGERWFRHGLRFAPPCSTNERVEPVEPEPSPVEGLVPAGSSAATDVSRLAAVPVPRPRRGPRRGRRRASRRAGTGRWDARRTSRCHRPGGPAWEKWRPWVQGGDPT